MSRLMSFRRLMYPSTGPVFHGFAQGGMNSVIVLPEAGGEAFEATALGLVDPGVQPIGQALLDHLRVAADETCRVRNWR
jgi:hypothetical protein